MSKQRIVKDEIWDDEWFYDLDPSEKLVWIFLLTNPRNNIAGVSQLNRRWGANSVGLDRDVFEVIINRFVNDGRIKIHEEWVCLQKFHKHQSSNPKVEAGVVRILENLPEQIAYILPIDSLCIAYPTLLNSTLLKLASDDAKNNMAWKKYNENQHSEDVPSIDMDSGEKIEDKSDQESKQVTQLIEWAEKVRGQKFLDRPTQRKFAYQLKSADLSLSEIRQTYMTLLNSEYWKEQKRLPDLKTVYSNLKNKKHE